MNTKFSQSTLRILVIGALILGAGIYYQTFAAQRLQESQTALSRVQGAQARADETKSRVEEYVRLLAVMTDKNINRQEPFSVVSEFSPLEISQLAPLLETLYQRDGYFFLQRFEISWRDENQKMGLLPRVALEIEGRKVLLFSNDSVGGASLTTAQR
ncbi:MAG: hypothetical protein ACWA5K_07310 [bacterium]